MSKSNRPYFFLLVLLVFLLTAGACTGATDTPPVSSDPTTAGTIESAASTPAPTETRSPTPTASPSRVILLAPPGSDPDLVAELESLLAELAEKDGLELLVSPQLNAVDIDENVQVVVAVAPDPGILALAASAPQTQFLTVGINGLKPGNNLSVIGALGDRPDRQGFIAGYLAATITPGWRVGVIAPGDTPSGRAAKGAFMNGVVFFCGLCRPSSPPYVEYPQFFDLPSGAGGADAQAAADYLIGNAVQTVYVFPGAGDEALLEYLAQAGVILIGGVEPPASLGDHWVASILSDWITPVREVWPRLLAGEGSNSLDVIIVIDNRNPTLFSIGRQRLVDLTLSELLAGYIDTGVDPMIGDPR